MPSRSNTGVIPRTGQVIEIGLVHVVARTGAFAVARNGRDPVQFGWLDDPLPVLASGDRKPYPPGWRVGSALLHAGRAGALLQTV